MNRIKPFSAAPKAYKTLIALDAYVARSGLSPTLIELVQLRSSQLNSCAFCIEVHSGKALAAGEDRLRLQVLSSWRSSPLFTAQERSALAWSEALTSIASGPVPDDVYAACTEHFTAQELVELSMAVAVINVWNRLGVAFEFEHVPALQTGSARS